MLFLSTIFAPSGDLVKRIAYGNLQGKDMALVVFGVVSIFFIFFFLRLFFRKKPDFCTKIGDRECPENMNGYNGEAEENGQIPTYRYEEIINASKFLEFKEGKTIRIKGGKIFRFDRCKEDETSTENKISFILDPDGEYILATVCQDCFGEEVCNPVFLTYAFKTVPDARFFHAFDRLSGINGLERIGEVVGTVKKGIFDKKEFFFLDVESFSFQAEQADACEDGACKTVPITQVLDDIPSK